MCEGRGEGKGDLEARVLAYSLSGYKERVLWMNLIERTLRNLGCLGFSKISVHCSSRMTPQGDSRLEKLL